MFKKIGSILQNDGLLGLLEAFLFQIKKAIFTLYYRFRFKYVGRRTIFEGHITLKGARYISLGDNVVVEPNAEFISTDGGRIDIGNSCLIRKGARVQVAGKSQAKLYIGNNVKIGENTFVSSSGSTIIGDKVWISRGCILGGNDVVIEERVVFGFNVNMIGRYHGFDPQTKGVSFEAEQREGKIRICENAWICTGAIILKDVTVGKCSVVAAGSVVTENVPPYTMVAGNPAVKKRDIS